MRQLHHNNRALAFYKIHTGFQNFKSRIREVLSATSSINLDDIVDDDTLHVFYRNGEAPDFVAASLGYGYED